MKNYKLKNMKEKLEYSGEVKGFPPEVVEKMLEKQVEQGNNKDISVFEENSRLSARYGGFNWRDTIEGADFWVSVIGNRHFDVFFERYPKIETVEVIESISEAFSMQPITLSVCKNPDTYFDRNKAIKEIKLETLTVGEIENKPVQDVFYVGYNYDGKKIFQYLAKSMNVNFL